MTTLDTRPEEARDPEARTTWRSLRALPAVLAYRRPLTRRMILLIPVLVGIACAIVVAYTPVKNAIGGGLTGIYPHWLIASDNAPAGFSKALLLSTMLATLAVDRVINPTVEELYFRGYLLPRLPVAGWRVIPLSAALFSLQHYWEPWNWAADLRAAAHAHHPGRPAALRAARHRHAHPDQQPRPPGRPGRRAELTVARRQEATMTNKIRITGAAAAGRYEPWS